MIRTELHWLQFCVRSRQDIRSGHLSQAGDEGPQETGKGLHPVRGHEQTDSRVPEDGSLSPGILLDAVRSERGIDRYWYPSGQENTKEGIKKILTGREHDCRSLALFETPVPEAIRTGGGSLKKLAVSDCLLLSA